MHKYYLDNSAKKWIYESVTDESNIFYCKELKQRKSIHISELNKIISTKEIELKVSEY